MTISGFVYTGRAWCLGDGVAVDGDLMPLEVAMARETRPEILRPHLMATIRPEFPKEVQPGDIVVAGKRFAQGNSHVQAFLGFASVGIGLVVESIPRNSLRNSVNNAIPLLPRCDGVSSRIRDADQLVVDFAAGHIRNLTQSNELSFPALSPHLLKIIQTGGWRPMLEQRLKGMASA
jgi:3-isopropylmalate/(R)-2-methylmalate dehydratase small subunit